MLLHRLSALALLLCLVSGLHAQQLPLDPPLAVSGVTYRADVPTPEEVLGYRIGARHTRPHEAYEYVRAIAEASDRVTFSTYARSWEGRPLVQAIITSPANHARLEEIRQANLQLSENPGSVGDARLATMPAIIWMGYSVHGNEASGTEAALLTLYHLAAGDGEEVQRVLDNTVVLLDPMYNPDGRDRFVDWVNSYRGAVPTGDPQDAEHNEAWPYGRTNHYWFDLNRDWLPAVNPESEGRLRLFHHWRPQVLTDYHEMGGEATYFFQPGIPSRTNPNTPALNQEMTGRIARFHADILDEIGSLYYTKESFDDFYYGKGSTYPDVNGSVGILFEQASSRALLADTRANGLLTYGFTVRNQAAASISSLRAAVALREELLKMQRDFYASSADVARRSGLAGFVFGDAGAPARARDLVRMLLKHRIRVHELGRAADLDGQRFTPGAAYFVPLDQPQARLVNALFERPTTFTDSLFYDVSAWTLPLAYGLPMAEARRADLAGREVTDAADAPGRIVGGQAAYAYAIPWGDWHAPRALYALQEAGIRVRLSPDPFTTTVAGERRRFERGTLVVSTVQPDGVPDTLHQAVARIVRENGLTAYALSTGLSLEGPDLGGRAIVTLEQPRIALVIGEGTDANNAGEMRWLLGERFRLPLSLLDADRLARLDLSEYTTILMAGGRYPKEAAEALKRWVNAGGHLIATSSAAGWAVENGLAALEAREADSIDSLLLKLPYAQIADTRGAQAVGGSIFKAAVDTTHPLGYGMPATMHFFRDSGDFFDPADVPGANVAVYTEAPLVAGYLSDERQEQASGAAALVALRQGRGRVVLMPDNPAFRAFWLGTSTFLLNAIFLSGAY